MTYQGVNVEGLEAYAQAPLSNFNPLPIKKPPPVMKGGFEIESIFLFFIFTLIRH